MSAPNIAVVIEPSDGSAIVYEPVAPENATSKAAGVLCLMLTITNNESKSIHLKQVELSFAGPPTVANATIPVPANWVPPGAGGVNIGAGASTTWNFLRDTLSNGVFKNDAVLLPDPAPASVTLSLSFDGFTPWAVTKTLAPHRGTKRLDVFVRAMDGKPGYLWEG